MIQYNNRKNSYPYAEHLSRINQLLGYYSEFFTNKLANLGGFELAVRFEITPEAKQNTQNQRSTSDPSGHGQVSIPLKHSRKYLCFSVTRTVLYTIKYDHGSLVILLSQRDALSLLKINQDELQRSLTELIMLACLELSEHIDIEESRAHLSASEVPGGMFDSDPVSDSEFGTSASSVYTLSLDEPLRLLQFNLKEICHMLGYYLMIENSQGHSNSHYQRKSFLPYRESISFSAENNSLEVFIVDTNQPIWDFNWREELNEKGDRITAFRYVISAGLLQTLSSMKQFELRDHILISIFAHTLRSKKRRTASQTSPRYYQSLDCIDDFKNRAQVYKVAILITLWKIVHSKDTKIANQIVDNFLSSLARFCRTLYSACYQRSSDSYTLAKFANETNVDFDAFLGAILEIVTVLREQSQKTIINNSEPDDETEELSEGEKYESNVGLLPLQEGERGSNSARYLISTLRSRFALFEEVENVLNQFCQEFPPSASGSRPMQALRELLLEVIRQFGRNPE